MTDKRLLLAVAWCLPACFASRDHSGPLIPEELGKLLIAETTEGTDQKTSAVVLAPGTESVAVAHGSDATTTLSVFAYETDLGLLGLSPGPLSIGASRRRLPYPDRIFTTRYTAGAEPVWSETSSLSPALAGLGVPAPSPDQDPCIQLTPLVSVDFPAGGREPIMLKIAIAISDTELFVGDQLSRFGVVTRVGGLGTWRAVSLPGAPHDSSFRAADGSIWLGGPNGDLGRVDPSIATVRLMKHAIATTSTVVGLDGSATGGGQFVAITADGGMYQSGADGKAWTLLMRDPELAGRGRVAWIEGGGVFVGPARHLWRLRDGVLTKEVLGDGEEPVTAFKVEGYGVFIAAEHLYRLSTGSDQIRRALLDPISATAGSIFVPYPNGFVLAQGSMPLFQYAHGNACPPVPWTDSGGHPVTESVVAMAVLGTEIVMASETGLRWYLRAK